MKIYIDTCCYSRPYDNQEHRSQESVELEIAAIESIADFCKSLGYAIVGSATVEFEISKVREEERERRLQIRKLYDKTITERIPLSDSVSDLAKEIRSLANIKNEDSFHIAYAEAADANFLLTTDLRLKNASSKLALKTKLIFPIDLLQELAAWAQLLT